MLTRLATISPEAWNIVGLLLVAAGVILLFFFAMPYRIRTGGRVAIVTNERDEGEVKDEKRYAVGDNASNRWKSVTGRGCTMSQTPKGAGQAVSISFSRLDFKRVRIMRVASLSLAAFQARGPSFGMVFFTDILRTPK
jgi:hypothetical protein